MSSDSSYFPMWPNPETATGMIFSCLALALPFANYQVEDMIIPLVRTFVSPPGTTSITRPPAIATPKIPFFCKQHPGCPFTQCL